MTEESDRAAVAAHLLVDREFILSPARRGGGGAAAPAFTRQQAAERQELWPLDLNLGLRHHPSRDNEVEQEVYESIRRNDKDHLVDGLPSDSSSTL